ncbi:MAG: alpha-N-acetylglucosaminidase [Muribaculaceae bacterium]|nr:alpha-N-acetylglucosaminidase [Muribaculaceae bacterium]
MKRITAALIMMVALTASAAHPVSDLIDRIAGEGSADRFVIIQKDLPDDFFEITTIDGKPAIIGNNPVNIAAGLNWYLKYYTGNHMSWNNLSISLPADSLPLPANAERHVSPSSDRYYLNYCTHSYSMPFWDWDRWEKEIDWMAMHGINMPLTMTGFDVVWRNTLTRLGYNKEEIDAFIAGPAFQAWWLMNNLEGWGGPNSDQWYADREELQKKILARMEELDMHPVFPGYSGTLPHDAEERLGVTTSGKGGWNGFTRPAFLLTTDPRFDEIADIYYEEAAKLYGTAKYYSMDPFHEGGSQKGVDLKQAGGIMVNAMKRANPDAIWVIQGWTENPRQELLDGVKPGDIVVLDLASEIRPQWGDPESPSPYERPDGYNPHDWMYCMLLNFGGNVGLHGKIDAVINGYYKAVDSKYAPQLKGIGLTMEAIENNPVMYELMSELPWRAEKFDKDAWLKDYITARYGSFNEDAYKGWIELASTIYNCPLGSLQQGTTESVYCARPSRNVWQVSSWSKMKPYYEPSDIIEAAKAFAKSADDAALRDNPNYVYDLVDITRQALSEKGRLTYRKMIDTINAGDKKSFKDHAADFLSLLDMQDELLGTLPDFGVGKWINSARALAPSEDEEDLFEENARLLITTWGPRYASEKGKLRDYAHREWSGLLRDFYRPRWETWINREIAIMDGEQPEEIDFYSLDEKWVKDRRKYTDVSGAAPLPTVDKALKLINSIK